MTDMQPNTDANTQTQGTRNEQLAVIPPGILLGISGFGFLVAIIVLFTQDTFSIVGWGGLGAGILSLVAWVFLAPEQALNLLRGRTVSYGGTGILVTVIFVVALIAIYVLIQQLGWRADLSTGEVFSLTQEAEVLVTQLTLDPGTPDVRILGFYGPTQGATRDQLSVLLDDFVRASDGKISYDFIDPDRQPLLVEQYNARAGSLFVVPLDEAGEPIPDQAEEVFAAGQQNLIDALIRATARGDFRAYFLDVADGLDPNDNTQAGAGLLGSNLRDVFNWTVESVSLVDLADPTSGVQLGSAADGEVLVIPGGSQPLPEAAVTIITDYLDGGGNVVIFGSINVDGDFPLAATPALSDYLFETFGLRMNNDVVFDLSRQFGSPFDVILTDFAPDQRITQNYNPERDFLLLQLPHSIELADVAPDNVTTTPIVSTTDQAYVKDEFNFTGEITNADIQQTADDPTGPFVVGAVAENSVTGARLVLWGSEAPLSNQFWQLEVVGIRNVDAARNSLFWAADYENFFENIPQLNIGERPQDTPLLADESQLRSITFISLVLLPFSVLGLGIFVWLQRRAGDAA